MNLSELKMKVHKKCIEILNSKIQEVKNQISELNLSFENEGKSSAGDKHETSRAMAQLETEKLHQQLHQFESQLAALNKLNPEKTNETIQNGSLIETDKGMFYIAVALGKVEDVVVISAASPLGKLLLGKKVGDEAVFNNLKYVIKETI